MLNNAHLQRADLNLLLLFQVVFEELHVGRAAERLNISSSAVSHGLGRLRRLLNDPLFLKTPKGVVPTARASELKESVAEILSRVGHVISSAAPFDAATSKRRFTIAAPDGVAAVLLPPLLAHLRDSAPGVDISVRQLLPSQGETSPDRVWRSAFAELESQAMDIAILPSDAIPVRFEKRLLLREDFVVAMRRGHPNAKGLSLPQYCDAQHLVVSLSGDPYGFIDRVLERQGRRRRVVVTVPNFMFALSIIADTDMIAALPRHFAAMHAPRFGLITKAAPLALEEFALNAVTPKVALMDAGVAWLFAALERASSGEKKQRKQAPPRRNATRRA